MFWPSKYCASPIWSSERLLLCWLFDVCTPFAMPLKRRTTDTETPTNPADDRAQASTSGAHQGPVKRQRVSRACDQCRAARERCDGKQPECYPCSSQSRPCTYQVSPKKRGVQTGYIRTLELALGWVLEKVPGSEETLGSFLAQEGGRGNPIMLGKDTGAADRLQNRWRKSRVHKGIDCILSGGTVPSPDWDGVSPSVDASDNEGDALRAGELGVGTEVAPGQPSTLLQPSEQHCLLSPSNDTRLRERVRRNDSKHSPRPPDRLKLPPNHWRLLDVYLSYTHSWLPILQKQDLFQASYLYPEEGLVIHHERPSSGLHAELWAALALGSLQDAASSSDDAGSASTGPADIYQTARGLIPSEDGSFQIHHARALLLLSLANLVQDSLTGAGLLNGSAIRILLDAKTNQSGAHDKDAQRTKLALMACFIVETILSVRCHKPPHLRAEDLAAFPLGSEGGPDQWEPWTPCDGFGSCHPSSRLSRSPAFCLSTFNQLYAIMRAVNVELLGRRRGLALQHRSEALAAQLREALDPNLPFAHFITSSICEAASVPTPYVARATYLWACALTDPHAEEGLLSSLEETLDQYQRQFGKCSLPPFIPVCIASLASEQYLPGFSKQQGDSIKALVSAYAPRSLMNHWWPPSRSGSALSPLTWEANMHNLMGMAAPTRLAPLSDRGISHGALAMPPPHDRLSASHHHTRLTPTGRSYNVACSTGTTGLYQGHNHNASIAVPQGSGNVQMHFGTGMDGALPGTTRQNVSTHYHEDHTYTPPHPRVPPAAFPGVSPDYDALLDDLASIECADAVDLDAQFMANLGFAPGCDIAEILTRDFGPV